MEVTRTKGMYSGYDYILKQDNKVLRIAFGGNLDLYWSLNNLDADRTLDCLYDEQCSPIYVLLTPKVPKVALIAMQRPHAKMCAARYPPHCAGPPAHVGGHDRLLSQPTFDAAADCYKGLCP